MSDVFPLKISIWETSVNMLNADFSVFYHHCTFLWLINPRPRILPAPQELLQDILKSKAGEIVYDDVAVGSDGFAAVCRGEADDTGAGSAAGGQAVE